MKKVYGGLETSITDHDRQFYKTDYRPRDRAPSPYRSQSERIIADILTNDDIPFGYEDDLHVPQAYTGGRSDRTWHPDFHLRDSEIIVEYVGLSDDKEYMKGIDKKKDVYAKMGAVVVWLYPDDLWAPTTNHKYGKLRDDSEEHVLGKIDVVARRSG